MLPGRWRPLDDGPREVMAMAVRESSGLRPERVLRTTGRKPTLSLVHEAIDAYGLEDLVGLAGINRVILQRYRRGENWPSWETQRRFRDLLAAGPVANLPDPLPAR